MQVNYQLLYIVGNAAAPDSATSSDSEDSFIIVPIPSCFDLTTSRYETDQSPTADPVHKENDPPLVLLDEQLDASSLDSFSNFPSFTGWRDSYRDYPSSLLLDQLGSAAALDLLYEDDGVDGDDESIVIVGSRGRVQSSAGPSTQVLVDLATDEPRHSFAVQKPQVEEIGFSMQEPTVSTLNGKSLLELSTV